MSLERTDIPKNIPQAPGVYFFKTEKDEVIYIGKATNLRSRVSSYFARELNRGPQIYKMLELAKKVDFETTGSEIAAIIREAKLIRKFKPRYNIALRDDKSFTVIRIDQNQKYPAIYLERERDLMALLETLGRERNQKIKQILDKNEYYGPYLSSNKVGQALKTLRKLWPYRDCSETKYNRYQKLGKGCLYEGLGLCSAPCARAISIDDYSENIKQIRLILQGKTPQLARDLQIQMNVLAEAEQFEEAMIIRERLRALDQLKLMSEPEIAYINNKPTRIDIHLEEDDLVVEAYDISNISSSYMVGVAVKAVIRGGKKLAFNSREAVLANYYFDKSGYRRFKIKTVSKQSDVDALKEVLSRRFLHALENPDDKKWALPDLIIIDGGQAQYSVAVQVKNKTIPDSSLKIVSVAKGQTRKKVDLYGEAWNELTTWELAGKIALAELMREEAHRFAIKFYREKHRKGIFK